MQRSLAYVLTMICLGCNAGAQTENWNRFRGPNGSGVSGDKGFPTTFDQQTNMLWRTAVRAGKSSPVLTRRHIFLTASDEGKLYTLCFNRTNGRLLWERPVDGARKNLQHGLNHEAAITPVTDGTNVYAFFKDFGLVSYDPEGNLRWKTPLGPFITTQGLASSPILAGNLVILVADQWEDSFIAGFNRTDGKLVWKVARTETEGWATPILFQPPGKAPRIVTTSRAQFGMHEVPDGKRTATLSGLATSIVASPVVDGDVVYAFGYGGEAPPPFSQRLRRFDKDGDGKLSPEEYGDDTILNRLARNVGNRDGFVTEDKWDVFAKAVLGANCLTAVKIENGGARELWRYDKNFTSVVPSVLAYQGVLYIARNGGILTTHDAATGKVLKSARIEGALGGYSSSPVAAEGKVWIAGEDGKVIVVRAGGEWQVLAVNDLGESCFATPALSGGVIYLRTDQALYAFASGASK